MKNSVLLRGALGLINVSFAAAAPIDGDVSIDAFAPLIVGGTNVPSATKYPFIGNLQLGGDFYCGSTILSATKILTAAHCVLPEPASDFKIRVGSLRYDSGGTLAQVVSKVTHPMYNESTIDYDVAVMTLSTPLTFSSTVAPATLVASGAEPADGQNTTTIGWGANMWAGESSPTLMEVDVLVVSRTTCNTAYESGIIRVTPRMLCAAASGKDSCQGDSGGPIFDASTRTILGGVSWGKGCAEPGYPGVYSDYANPEINAWIRAQL